MALTFTRASWYHAQRASCGPVVDRDVEPARRAGADAQTVACQRATVRYRAARDRQIRLGVRQEPDLTTAPLRNHLAHARGGALGVKQPTVEQQSVDASRAVPLQKLHDVARDRRVTLIRKPERNQAGARLRWWVRARHERQKASKDELLDLNAQQLGRKRTTHQCRAQSCYADWHRLGRIRSQQRLFGGATR